jgi:hypothetical protein
MRIHVTGGAGSIGSEYVRRRLNSEPTARIAVLDKLTCSGVEANLTPVAEHPDCTFVRGDICDSDVAGQDAVDQRGLVDRGVTAGAELPVLRVVGRLRSAGVRLPPYPRPGGRGHPVLQQLRRYQFSEKVFPLFITHHVSDG